MGTGLARMVATTLAVAAVLAAGVLAPLGGQSRAQAAVSPTTGVVVVSTRLAYSQGAGAGTGIVLTSSGTVLTNNHVIRGAEAIRVTDVSSGRTYSATVRGYSVGKDIAVLRLSGAHGLRAAPTGSASTVRVGDRVMAVGNTGGSGRLTTKRGTVTGLRRSITVTEDGTPVRLTGLIETTAVLRQGDSGGPLLVDGRVVGVDAAASTGFRFESSAQGYAIPIDTALAVVRQVQAGRSTSTVHVGPTAFLGVALAPVAYEDQTTTGALVEGVAAGSPADKAGIGAGDVITAFAGRRVSSPAALRTLILRTRPGRTVRIVWVDRYTGTQGASVRLVAGPPQ